MVSNEQELKPGQESALPPTPETIDAGVKQAPVATKSKMAGGEGNKNLMMLLGSGAALAVALLFGLSHKETPGHKQEAAATQGGKATQTGTPQRKDQLPGDQVNVQQDQAAPGSVTAAQIENTKLLSGATDQSGAPDIQQRQVAGVEQGTKTANPTTYGATQTGPLTMQQRPAHGRVAAALNTIPEFRPPAYLPPGAAAPQAGEAGMSSEAVPGYAPVSMSAGSANEIARAYQDEVSKPSLVFTAQQESAKSGGSVADREPVVTNFGLQTGFHIPAHLEASVSTIGGVPAVAIVEYNVMKDGRLLIPAGSRFIGKISGANATGAVNLTFNEVILPNGTASGFSVPVNAVGLDPFLHPIKGKVEGRNYGKMLLFGALANTGALAAGFAGNSSTSITQMDLARMQVANNIGNSGDQVMQAMNVSQAVTVTVPSGTQLYVTFVAPVKVAPGLKTASAHIEP